MELRAPDDSFDQQNIINDISELRMEDGDFDKNRIKLLAKQATKRAVSSLLVEFSERLLSNGYSPQVILKILVNASLLSGAMLRGYFVDIDAHVDTLDISRDTPGEIIERKVIDISVTVSDSIHQMIVDNAGNLKD